MMSSEGRAAGRKADPMPTTAVEVLHDDGRWYVAKLLGQHRDRETGGWRCGVRYSSRRDAVPAGRLGRPVPGAQP